jgi:uncharacterized protein (TIGR00290 family)
MEKTNRAILSWSGGKDSALALYRTIRSDEFEIVSLLTTVTSDYDRVSMHGFRRDLLLQQAEALDYSLDQVMIPKECSNAEYEKQMRSVLEKHVLSGVHSVVFGDIFLEDIRKYREEKLSELGMDAVFPLWCEDTTTIAEEFIKLGFKCVVTCVDSKLVGIELAKVLIGREYNSEFLSMLPEHVDPCGENGEFHTFVYDGPIFKNRISVQKGEIVVREDRFYFCDLRLK